jgi:predicted O-methyltransferase YrrM
MDKKLALFLKELESFGLENDKGMTDKFKRMRNVTPETGRLLAFLASVTQAKNILEIGTSNGYSTLWLADSVSENEGLVTTLEYSTSKATLAKNNFEEAKMMKWIDLIVMDAGEYIRGIQSNTVDMIFLDSERKEYVKWWEDVRRILKKNGLIIVDNAISHIAELQDFIELVTKDENYITFNLPIESGLLLLTKK